MTETTTISEAYQAARPFRVIIAGTRTFADADLLYRKCDEILAKKPLVSIVTGANVRRENSRIELSADLLGVIYAIERGHVVVPFPADWSKGKSAGPKRNRSMAEYADALIAF